MTVREALRQFYAREKAPEYRTMVDVVRCGECAHGSPGVDIDDNPAVECSVLHATRPLDWYCADGVRK